MKTPKGIEAGFAKLDITPDLGVELCGFGPFRHRRSIGVRDQLWARAMALSKDGEKQLLISCDIIGIPLGMTRRIRALLAERVGLNPENIMICCSHTHSGPSTGTYIGWGDPDLHYLESLPLLIARAGLEALSRMEAVEFSHAEVSCEGIGLNREYDRDAPPLEEVLREDWRPAKPELTDTTCHVITAKSKGRLAGFISYFGCHPVVCCAENRYIHGDYCGVATNMLERENPGAVGLFVLGAHGDVNSCVVHKPEKEALLALDVIAARYANAVRQGINSATPFPIDKLACRIQKERFTRKPFSEEQLLAMLSEREALLQTVYLEGQQAADKRNPKLETVYILGMRKVLAEIREKGIAGESTELQGFRLGKIRILGSGFETFQAIKNDLIKKSPKGIITLVASQTNDCCAYAPDRTAAARGGYAADMTPFICGMLPYAKIHDELVSAFIKLNKGL